MTSLVRTVDATEEPVSLAEAQAFLRVDSSDDATEIEAIIKVARQMVEDFTGRALLTQTWKFQDEEWPDADDDEGPLVLPLNRSPLATVVSVKYYPFDGGAQTTLDSSKYHVLTGPMPGQIVLKYGEFWPYLYSRPDAVEVEFTAGAASAADVPPTLRHAVLLLIAHLYENRAPINIGNIVNEIPYTVKHLLESHRVGGWIA